MWKSLKVKTNSGAIFLLCGGRIGGMRTKLMAVLLEQISSNIYMEAVYEAHVRTRCSQTPMMRLFDYLDYLLSLNPEPIARLVI